VRLHCRTSGGSNDLLHRLLCWRNPPYALPPAQGVLGDLDAQAVGRIAGAVAEDGYYVFPDRLPRETCENLLAFATSHEAALKPAKPPLPGYLVYERGVPQAETYWFDEQTLFDCPEVQALAADASLLAVAQSYLKAKPILDIVGMWWSTAFSKQASTEAAQLYHFDMDRIKWIKFFVYLTDVTPENGPHCFVAKSHRRNGQPRELLRRGQTRIPDGDVRRCYPAEALLEFTGPAGTIIAEDSRGFHKGKPVQSGDRLILEFEFSDSLFGATYPKTHLKSTYTKMLRDRARKYPRSYSHFIVDEEA